MQDVAAGQVNADLSPEPIALPLVQAGRVRVSASSRAQRSPCPTYRPTDLPTFKAVGPPGPSPHERLGAFVPGSTPAALTGAASAALALVVGAQGPPEASATAATVPQASTAAGLGMALRNGYGFWFIVFRPTIVDPPWREPEIWQRNRAPLAPFMERIPLNNSPFQQLAAVVLAVDTGIHIFDPVADVQL